MTRSKYRTNVPDFDTDRDPGDEQEENKFEYTQDELDEIKRMHEAWEFDKWWNEGFVLANKRNRIEAFAAIRRAAQLARQADRDCAATRCMGHGCPHADDASIVRRAIRAAIGSDKA